MAEFQVIKRTDVPNAGPVHNRAVMPIARLHRNGTLYLSVTAAAALGDRHCRCLVEFDESTSILKLTVAGEKLPKGFTLEDTFLLRFQKGPHSHRPLAMICLKSLLRYIGFEINGVPQVIEIERMDADERSISLVLPAEQFAKRA